EHVDAAHAKQTAFATQEFYHGESDWVGPARRARGKDAVGPLVAGRTGDEIVAFGSIECPDYKEVRKAFDVGEPVFEFRQDLERTLSFMLGPQSFGNRFCVGIWAACKPDCSGRKHCDKAPA